MAANGNALLPLGLGALLLYWVATREPASAASTPLGAGDAGGYPSYADPVSGGQDALGGLLANQEALRANQDTLAAQQAGFDAWRQGYVQGGGAFGPTPGGASNGGPPWNALDAAKNEFRSSPIFTTAVAGGAVAAGLGAAAGAASRFGRAAPQAARAVEPVRYGTRFPTALRYGGAAAAGAALGQAGVYGLEKSGAFNVVAAAGRRIPAWVGPVARTTTLPLTIPGAVSAGLAGRGSVGRNIQAAVKGTPVDWVNRNVFAPIGRFRRK